MGTRIATLSVDDLGDGNVRLMGRATLDGSVYDVNYVAPRFLVDTVLNAAKTADAVTLVVDHA